MGTIESHPTFIFNLPTLLTAPSCHQVRCYHSLHVHTSHRFIQCFESVAPPPCSDTTKSDSPSRPNSTVLNDLLPRVGHANTPIVLTTTYSKTFPPTVPTPARTFPTFLTNRPSATTPKPLHLKHPTSMPHSSNPPTRLKRPPTPFPPNDYSPPPAPDPPHHLYRRPVYVRDPYLCIATAATTTAAPAAPHSPTRFSVVALSCTHVTAASARPDNRPSAFPRAPPPLREIRSSSSVAGRTLPITRLSSRPRASLECPTSSNSRVASRPGSCVKRWAWRSWLVDFAIGKEGIEKVLT